MRLQTFSDIHADEVPPRKITVTADNGVVIVACDVCEDTEVGFALLRQIVPMPLPIVKVMGNHECENAGFNPALVAEIGL
jgi:hypothetical protein